MEKEPAEKIFAMSKLSFRARALDANKAMPIYKLDEIPDLPDFAAINRAVPQMPTGMEKEEETVRSAWRIQRHLVFVHLGKNWALFQS